MFVTASINKVDYNSLVLCGFEYVERMPVGFFDFSDPEDERLFHSQESKSSAFNGTLNIKLDGFKPIEDENGNLKAPEVCIVSRAKARPVLIFQDIDFNQKYHDNVFVIPIQTLRKPQKEHYSDKKEDVDKYESDLQYYEDLVNKSNKVYDQYYFPKILDSGEIYERVLRLSDSRFIHKSFLIKQLPENGLDAGDLKEINIRLSKMLNIKNIEQCSRCEYSHAIENIKKILSRVERLEKNA